jgi:hypothetical protein
MRPRAYRSFLPAFLAFYAIAGFLTHTQFLGHEIFPLFSWSLYSGAASNESMYTARLLEVERRSLVPPMDVMETPAFHRAPDYWRDAGVLNAFGEALEAGDRARAAAFRCLVESNVLLGDSIRYEMVKRTYDPLARRATGSFEETSLGIFVKERAGGGC